MASWQHLRKQRQGRLFPKQQCLVFPGFKTDKIQIFLPAKNRLPLFRHDACQQITAVCHERDCLLFRRQDAGFPCLDGFNKLPGSLIHINRFHRHPVNGIQYRGQAQLHPICQHDTVEILIKRLIDRNIQFTGWNGIARPSQQWDRHQQELETAVPFNNGCGFTIRFDDFQQAVIGFHIGIEQILPCLAEYCLAVPFNQRSRQFLETQPCKFAFGKAGSIEHLHRQGCQPPAIGTDLGRVLSDNIRHHRFQSRKPFPETPPGKNRQKKIPKGILQMSLASPSGFEPLFPP